jgi:anti-anti-sigma regulatory factor
MVRLAFLQPRVNRHLPSTFTRQPETVDTRMSVRPANRRTRASLPAVFTLDDDETTGHRLRKLALDPRIDELLIDGRAVHEVSARGLGLLVALSRLTEARGAATVLIDPSPELVEYIDRRGLSAVLLPQSPIATVSALWPQPAQMTRVLEPVD